MEIWLKHPQHGVKCAYIVAEAENDEKNGWIRFDPSVKQDEQPVETEEAAETAVVAHADAPKKRGPKPKNRG